MQDGLFGSNRADDQPDGGFPDFSRLGMHPDGLLGGLNWDSSAQSASADSQRLPARLVQAPGLPSFVLDPADPALQMPALPTDGAAGTSPASGMTATPDAPDFLKSYEKGPAGGPALTPYHSPEGGRDTIGWGHKVQAGEDFSRALTQDQADQLLLRDLASRQRLVQRNVQVPLSQQQFDALTSLAYNSPRALDPKTSLMQKLNAGDYAGAADQFLRWNHAGKTVMPGLTERRGNERSIFLDGIYTTHK